MTALVMSCALYFSAQASSGAGKGDHWTVSPEVTGFVAELRSAVLAHEVARIVRLMEPSGLQCEAGVRPVSSVKEELQSPGSYWHSFFFDTSTLNEKYSDTGVRRVSLEELFRSGVGIAAENDNGRLEFRASNYDIYPVLYVKKTHRGWVIACDPRCSC